MSDHALTAVSDATSPALPALFYAKTVNPLAGAVRYGYSSEHRLDKGPSQMRPDSAHIFPYDGDENRCRACVHGACIQRVELWPDGFILIVHDCRPELS
jgi:hypothetical protein